MWFLAWMPRALAEGTNPLLTDRLNAPDGVNLMWNTAVPLIALAVAPVTLLGGPILAYNVALAGAVAMSGLACFVACRRLAGGFAGPLVGGAVYALSPYMASHAALHLPLVAVWGPPLFLVLLHELLVRRRSRPAFVGAGLGLLAALQILTAEELLATSAIAATVLAIVLALLAPDRAALVDGARRIAAAAVPAALVFALVAGPALAVQFLGPQRVHAAVQDPAVFSTVLLNVVVPTPYQLIAPPLGTEISRDFSGLFHEATAYLGLPLVLLLVGIVVVRWSDRRIRVAGVVGLVMLVLSLGPVLHVGVDAMAIPMPWSAFRQLPLLEHVLPGRLTLFTWLAVAVIVAIVVQGLLVERPARAAPRLALLGGALLLALPAPLAYTEVDVPPVFAAWDEAGIPDDATILFAPHFTNGAGAAPMLWAAVAGARPRMVEAYAYVPDADGRPRFGPAPTQLTRIMDTIQDDGSSIVARGGVREQTLQDLADAGVTHVVVGPMPNRPQMVAFFTDLLGGPPQERGGLDVWPIGSTTPAG